MVVAAPKVRCTVSARVWGRAAAALQARRMLWGRGWGEAPARACGAAQGGITWSNLRNQGDCLVIQ